MCDYILFALEKLPLEVRQEQVLHVFRTGYATNKRDQLLINI